MCESKFLEYKEKVTNTFLKTVSAFANYGTGKILFGVKDDGTIVGINNAQKVCLDIENVINDSISPQPDYSIEINKKSVIILTVREGLNKPYLYKSKAYKRNDTSTVEADRLEFTRLILEGKNISYENLKAEKQKLTFKVLERNLKNIVGIKTINNDILRTLELYSSNEGYNKAGEILADVNTLPGIDIVRFGSNINIILNREIIEKESVLTQYEKALEIYRKYYTYEEIKGSRREIIETVPEKAFREAVINALLHRTWDVKAQIRIAMFEDRVEIMSPGSLPKGLSEKEYLDGQVSILRNPILGNVLFRLHLIERFGTGVKRINEEYLKSRVKPKFEFYDNSIKVTLPVMELDLGLKDDELRIYNALKNKQILSSSEITGITGFGKNKTIEILKKLVEQGYIKVTGSGRGTKYGIY
ncbi:MAG: putative DNA binding domain-containing protein [Candidatus Riflebacteria bacterium]|nr:putative DNA binding domain-containing protein [Candidatus Riflebacteria bacterium]